MTKLTDYDPAVLLPNQPPLPELTLEQQAAMLDKIATKHIAKQV